MPELPEVETTCRGIEKHILGNIITDVIVREHQLRYLIDKKIAAKLKGKKITGVERRAKYILIHVQDADDILIHLGMSGSLRIVTKAARDNLKKHDHIDWVLKNGKILRYHDPRKFGLVLLDDNVVEHKLLKNLGPEPLHAEFDSQYLKEKSKGRKIAIKKFIMDQKVVVGVGNIYAAEALFMSGINPKTKASGVSLVRYLELVKNIKIILSKAIDQGGTTLKDFVNGDGKPGYFQQQLFVYGRGGKPCHVCTNTLKEITLGQRTSVYCTTCQT